MAPEEVIRTDSLGNRGAIVGIAQCKENRGQGDEQNVLADGNAMDREGALGEGAQEWI